MLAEAECAFPFKLAQSSAPSRWKSWRLRVAVHDFVVPLPVESGTRRYPRARSAPIVRVRRRPATVERKRERSAKVLCPVCRASSVAIATVIEVKNPYAVASKSIDTTNDIMKIVGENLS